MLDEEEPAYARKVRRPEDTAGGRSCVCEAMEAQTG